VQVRVTQRGFSGVIPEHRPRRAPCGSECSLGWTAADQPLL